MPAGKTQSSPPTHRVISIIELLVAAPGPLTSAEIADGLELNRSTAGSILAALADRGWVRRLPDLSYELGPALAALGRRATGANDERAWLDRELERLADRVDCGAALTTITLDHLEFLAVTRDRYTVGIEAGARIPLLAPAGAAIIAHWGTARQEDWLRTRGPERRAEYRAVLSTLRATGHCVWKLESDSIPNVRVLSEVADHLADHPASKELRGRVLAQLAAIGGSAYDQRTLDRDIPLAVSYIGAPVFDSGGHAVMELQIGPLRDDVTRAERRHYLSELSTASRRISAALDSLPTRLP
ncbi:helix-turn-helix domain-containing protein [Nocardia sp. CDC160]|uniref:helix-turn-helix domain-containing protein n=1 Tax=Nocardia sp. CDC160 TaxID=3112166 RepID=UPI002DB61536|nr:helix-turn-helix domain-containing protein [Nocardia sp. CDC160]MEC3915092.1 helix-turn-helix domain-containing protein [Nocardia sp. CDC160]